MDGSWTIGFSWWVSVVELPAMASLFWLIWRNRRDWQETVEDHRSHFLLELERVRDGLAAYKLEVAQTYASIAYIRDIERRLTRHLVRIEDKLDHNFEVKRREA